MDPPSSSSQNVVDSGVARMKEEFISVCEDLKLCLNLEETSRKC